MSLAHNIQDGVRTQDVRMPPNVTFETLLLKSTTIEGLTRSGFYKPSPIQLHGIPMGKCGFDLLLEAKSGTGKTAVFSIIALEMLDLRKGLQVVILAPTREIAQQICDVMKQIGSSYDGLQIEVVMGGLPIHEDILKFKGNKVHVVVGSPGRLKHLIQEKHIDVNAVRLLVLDEADRLMESSFQNDINYIFSLTPKIKQVIMSSATYPDETKTFINKYVQSAQHICPDSDSILLGIAQKITLVKTNSNIVKQTKYRFEELLKILSSHPFKQCLIFCNYQARVMELHKMLKKEKWPAEQLYGKQEQTDRLDALKTLQQYKCRILISTDLAARGIDASNVDLVINFEPPYEWQTYLHRIGRAGRFGSYGKAVTILSNGAEQEKFKKIIKSIKSACKLGNLWDDEIFQLNDDDESVTSESVTCNDISLTISSKTEDKEIVTPEPKAHSDKDPNGKTELQITDKELSKVEEKVKEIIQESSKLKPSTIQSFSDLQASFASRSKGKTDEPIEMISQQPTNNEQLKTEALLDAKTLQTITETVTGMIGSLTEIETPVAVKFEDLEKDLQNFREVFIENENNIASPTENLKKNVEIRKQENNNISDNSKGENDIEKSDVNILQFHDNRSDPRKHIDLNQDEYNIEYYSNVKEALRLAGLPTAFGKNYDTWNQTKGPDKRHVKKSQKGNRKMHFENDSESSSQPKNHQRAKKDKRISSDDDSTEDLQDYGYYSRSQSHRYQQNNHTKASQKYDYYENNESYDTQGSLGYSNINYEQWYRQLKQVTRQIEMAVYIDELSKLSIT